MNENMFDITMVELPKIVPVIPFTGSFLFPGMKLKLRLFETRYIRLILNALASSRVVGVVQPTEKTSFDKSPNIYNVGCLGRISSFSEGENNLLLVTLTGVSRFRIVKELNEARTYKNVEVDFSPFAQDFNPPKVKIDRQSLMEKLDRYAYSNNLDLSFDLLKKAEDCQLLYSLASMLPFQPAEKQALLECSSPQKFYETLLILLDMATDNHSH